MGIRIRPALNKASVGLYEFRLVSEVLDELCIVKEVWFVGVNSSTRKFLYKISVCEVVG
jgi:hypothetical protein